jgi:Fe-Mn family superoxide dismutase
MQMTDKIVAPQHAPLELPYSMDALAPFMSRETLEYHYGKHHRGYVNKLNALIAGTEFENTGLDYIVKNSSGAIFNNAAQAWNHAFFWRCIAPNGGGEPPAELGSAIERDFGTVDTFKRFFRKAATEKFGSGWIWLVRTRDGRLVVCSTDDADNPLRSTDRALLACDVWEHAYYIDYRNDRAKYLDAFWNLVNWRFVEENLNGRREKPSR